MLYSVLWLLRATVPHLALESLIPCSCSLPAEPRPPKPRWLAQPASQLRASSIVQGACGALAAAGRWGLALWRSWATWHMPHATLPTPPGACPTHPAMQAACTGLRQRAGQRAGAAGGQSSLGSLILGIRFLAIFLAFRAVCPYSEYAIPSLPRHLQRRKAPAFATVGAQTVPG